MGGCSSENQSLKTTVSIFKSRIQVFCNTKTVIESAVPGGSRREREREREELSVFSVCFSSILIPQLQVGDML